MLAISSGGGHWAELLRLRPAFKEFEVVYATSEAGYREDIGEARFHVIGDASLWDKPSLLRVALRVLCILLRELPDVVVSTGAAPGWFAVVLGRILGSRTVWMDSIANVDELSLSGKRAGRHAEVWLTQWPHLAKPGGPHCLGQVL